MACGAAGATQARPGPRRGTTAPRRQPRPTQATCARVGLKASGVCVSVCRCAPARHLERLNELLDLPDLDVGIVIRVCAFRHAHLPQGPGWRECQRLCALPPYRSSGAVAATIAWRRWSEAAGGAQRGVRAPSPLSRSRKSLSVGGGRAETAVQELRVGSIISLLRGWCQPHLLSRPRGHPAPAGKRTAASLARYSLTLSVGRAKRYSSSAKHHPQSLPAPAASPSLWAARGPRGAVWAGPLFSGFINSKRRRRVRFLCEARWLGADFFGAEVHMLGGKTHTAHKATELGTRGMRGSKPAG